MSALRKKIEKIGLLLLTVFVVVIGSLVLGSNAGSFVLSFVSVTTVRLSGSEGTVLLRLSLGMNRVLLVGGDGQQQGKRGDCCWSAGTGNNNITWLTICC